jgi:hypothetical protein
MESRGGIVKCAKESGGIVRLARTLTLSNTQTSATLLEPREAGSRSDLLETIPLHVPIRILVRRFSDRADTPATPFLSFVVASRVRSRLSSMTR